MNVLIHQIRVNAFPVQEQTKLVWLNVWTAQKATTASIQKKYTNVSPEDMLFIQLKKYVCSVLLVIFVQMESLTNVDQVDTRQPDRPHATIANLVKNASRLLRKSQWIAR